MKKNFIIVICYFCCFYLFSEEMQLYKTLPDYNQFQQLSVEEQYTSVINSFKNVRDSSIADRWIRLMVSQYGRECLSYINKTLLDARFDHETREPIDTSLGLQYEFFNSLMEENLLTEDEIQLYIVIIKGKLKEYILKYRVIDGNARLAYEILNILNYSWNEEEYIDGERLKAYYERELGITGIVAGDVESVFSITESPLAEYITD